VQLVKNKSVLDKSPGWAHGMTLVMSVIVSSVLALGINVSGVFDNYFVTEQRRQEQEYALKTQELQAINTLLALQQESLVKAVARIEVLEKENFELKQEIFRLNNELEKVQAQGP
jgi:dynactin complex subunit